MFVFLVYHKLFMDNFTKEDWEQLKFFSDKVANVHGGDHAEYIRVNEIVKDIDFDNLKKDIFVELRELTNNYVIPEWACRAQTTLLNLINKLDEK